jgi:hypothetical protein
LDVTQTVSSDLFVRDFQSQYTIDNKEKKNTFSELTFDSLLSFFFINHFNRTASQQPTKPKHHKRPDEHVITKIMPLLEVWDFPVFEIEKSTSGNVYY